MTLRSVAVHNNQAAGIVKALEILRNQIGTSLSLRNPQPEGGRLQANRHHTEMETVREEVSGGHLAWPGSQGGLSGERGSKGSGKLKDRGWLSEDR